MILKFEPATAEQIKDWRAEVRWHHERVKDQLTLLLSANAAGLVAYGVQSPRVAESEVVAIGTGLLILTVMFVTAGLGNAINATRGSIAALWTRIENSEHAEAAQQRADRLRSSGVWRYAGLTAEYFVVLWAASFVAVYRTLVPLWLAIPVAVAVVVLCFMAVRIPFGVDAPEFYLRWEAPYPEVLERLRGVCWCHVCKAANVSGQERSVQPTGVDQASQDGPGTPDERTPARDGEDAREAMNRDGDA